MYTKCKRLFFAVLNRYFGFVSLIVFALFVVLKQLDLIQMKLSGKPSAKGQLIAYEKLLNDKTRATQRACTVRMN